MINELIKSTYAIAEGVVKNVEAPRILTGLEEKAMVLVVGVSAMALEKGMALYKEYEPERELIKTLYNKLF